MIYTCYYALSASVNPSERATLEGDEFSTNAYTTMKEEVKFIYIIFITTFNL